MTRNGVHILDSARKHSIPDEDILYALTEYEVEDVVPGRDGHGGGLIRIGHPHGQTDRYIEVMYAIVPPRSIVVFHAMPLTDKWAHLLL